MTIDKKDLALQSGKIAPPVYAFFTGLTLNDWVAILTILYLGLQIASLIRKWIADEAARKAAKVKP